jgi:hypothetical protein
MAASKQAAAHPVGLWGAVAIGVGGMVGGGIFAVLGLSVQITKRAAPLAFMLAGRRRRMHAHRPIASAGRRWVRGSGS